MIDNATSAGNLYHDNFEDVRLSNRRRGFSKSHRSSTLDGITSIRLTADLQQRARDAALAEDRSVSSLVRQLLKAHLDREHDNGDRQSEPQR